MEATDLNDCSILKEYPIKSDIKKLYIFEDCAIMLKEDGNIYGSGRNHNRLIVAGKETHVYCSMVNITGSVSQTFKDFTTNGRHAMAISKKGFLFLWGFTSSGYKSFHQVQQVLGIRVDKIACGNGFSLVQTMEGNLIEWGCYGYRKLELDFSIDGANSKDQLSQCEESKLVHSICAREYPMVLTKLGKIFIPVLPRTKKENNMIEHEKLHQFGDVLKNKKVVQLLIGYKFAFALTDKGEIFHWTLSDTSLKDPEHIDTAIERAAKLWTSSSADILVVTNSYGNHFSLCRNAQDEKYSTSQLNFSSVGKYFLYIGVQFAGPAYVQAWANVDEEKTEVPTHWKNKFESAFNVKDDSDVAFLVGEKVIYAHKAIVSIQCSYLGAMLNNKWKEYSDNRAITIKEYTYPTYFKFLRYLYTGKLEFGSPEENLELLQLAHEYLESNLLNICEKKIIGGLSVENVFTIYKSAQLLELKCLLNACRLFMGKHIKDVVCTEEFKNQESVTLVNFFMDMITSGNIHGNE